MSPIRVLVVDDSAFMRQHLKAILELDRHLEVIDTARNGQEAVQKVKELHPDVVTLDINMPVMDGLTALAYIMLECPTPTVMVSSLTQEGALATFEAIELGAVDFVSKASGTVSLDIEDQAEEIITKVKAAARAKLRRRSSAVPHPQKGVSRPERITPAPRPNGSLSQIIVAIGVSTGGPRTLMDILPSLPANLPVPVTIVQHMPATFTASFAEHLNAVCAIKVKEAEQAEPLLPGVVYVAPGGYQMTVSNSVLGKGAAVRLSTQNSGYAFCPSVNVLFNSIAQLYGSRAIGVLLTGMGDDGADGMVKIRHAGGHTIAESEETAVIFGMPHEAIERGGAEVIAPSTDIANQIQIALRRIK
jgi:two-component system, chemotaxis family, protein-glutamate methylesterase/glutaminase